MLGIDRDPDYIIEYSLNCTPREFKKLMDKAFEERLSIFGKDIHFFAPGVVHYDIGVYKATNPYRFPAISVTGPYCSLQCKHCHGKILQSMIYAKTPEKLYEICSRIRDEGGIGCLISGGSRVNGSVPLEDFIPVMKRVKEELGLKIIVHTGFPHHETIRELAKIGIDGVLIDVIGSDETLREVYNLRNMDVNDIDRILTLLDDYDVPVIPHIVVGLHYGRILGEKEALKMVSRHNIKALAIVVIMPLPETEMTNVLPPRPLDVARVIIAARLLMPYKPVLLGCARPRGPYKSAIDALSIRIGVNGIAYPSLEGYLIAKKLDLKIHFHQECCSLIWYHLDTPASSRQV